MKFASRLAIVVGLTATMILIVAYQDWWAIIFVLGGATIAMLERGGVGVAAAIVMAFAVMASLATAGIGAFLIVMSPFSCARPDVPCPSGPPPILVVGLGALLVSVIGMVLVVLYVRRRQPR